MKLSDLYLALAAALDVFPNEETKYLCANYGEEIVPITVPVVRNGQTVNLPVIIPDDEVMKVEEDGTTIKFHPYAESPFGGQSEMLNRLIILAGGKLCTTVISLVSQLINLSVNYEEFDKYSNKTMQLIGKLPPVKKDKSREKILEYANKVMRANTAIAGQHPLLRINVGRRERSDIKALRWCELSLPVLKDDGDMRIFGVKAPSKLAYDTVYGAFATVLGHDSLTEDNKVFLNGSLSQTAPYFQALLKTLKEATEHFNHVLSQMGRQGDKSAKLNTDWFGLLDDPDTLVKEIPVPFEGNVGKADGKSASIAVAEGTQAPKPAAINMELSSKAKAPAPVTQSVAQTTTIDHKDTMNTMRKQTMSALHKTNASAASTSMRKQPAQSAVRDEAPVEVAETAKKPQLEIGTRSREVASANNQLQIGARVRETQVHDALGEPVFTRNGQPLMMPSTDKIHKELFIIAREPNGTIAWNGDVPHLDPITRIEVDRLKQQRQGNGAYGAGPARMGYQPQPAAFANPNDPRNRYQLAAPPAQPGYGQPAAPGYGQPGYGQPGYGQPAAPVYGTAPAYGTAPGYGYTSQPIVQGTGYAGRVR